MVRFLLAKVDHAEFQQRLFACTLRLPPRDIMRKADRRTARSEGVDGWGTGVDHRGHAEAEIKSLQQLLAGASDVRNTALPYMLDAQTELLRRGDFGDGRRNAGLARGIADLLHRDEAQ